MNLIEYCANSEVEDIALIIKALLDRFPILVIGEEETQIENLISELSSIVSFRNIMIYYTDFVEYEDYLDLKENENLDFETQRNQFLSYPFASEKALEQFKNFKSWIFGYCPDINKKIYEKIFSRLYENTDFFLLIDIKSDKLQTEINGKTFRELNLDFEKWIYQNAIKGTEVSLERMKRVLSKRIKRKQIGEEAFENIMNFSFEQKQIQENIIKKEIQNFYDASRRTFGLLNRMKNLEMFGYSTKLSSKTLFSTIAYNNAPMQRLIEFIEAEWNELYQPFLEKKKVSNFTDTFESLWG